MTKLPTISFKGKEYVTVAERVKYFNEEYENGCIETFIISKEESDRVVFKAMVTPDVGVPDRVFTGYSQAKWSDTTSFVNKTSALENAETSSVGRALALMGIGLTDSIASIDEINKASHTVEKISTGKPFTADEYEEANAVLGDVVQGAIKQANVQYRADNPPVKRNPNVQFGKKATGERLKQTLNKKDDLD